jgi:hypothetical protein
MDASSDLAKGFLEFVKTAYEKSIEQLITPGFGTLPTDVLTQARRTQTDLSAPAKRVKTRADALNTEFDAEEKQYTADIDNDKSIETEAFKQVFEKTQMWMITESPTINSYKGLSNNVINIPVYHFRLRASNLTNFSGEEMPNDTKLKVEFQKFSKDD